MLLGAVVVSASVLAACGSSASSSTATSGSKTPTTVTVAFDSNAVALPVWVAYQEGIFTKNHLKVNFTTIQNLSTLPGTLGNTFDIVLSTPTELISAASKGLPVVEVSGAALETPSNPDGGVIVNPSSGATSLAGLEGKSVGTLTLNGTLVYGLEYDLLLHHLSPTGIHLVVMSGPTMQDNMKANNVQAVVTVPPFISQLTHVGYKELFDPFNSVRSAPGAPLSAIFWIGSRAWTNSHTTAVKEWTTSLNEAQSYISSHPSTARSVLAKYTSLPAAVVKSFPLPLFSTALKPGDIARWEHVMTALGILKSPPSSASLVVK